MKITIFWLYGRFLDTKLTFHMLCGAGVQYTAIFQILSDGFMKIEDDIANLASHCNITSMKLAAPLE